MENTPNIRTQTLIWHSMESQIKWSDNYCFQWFSTNYVAIHKNGSVISGKFKAYEDADGSLERAVFESGEYTYMLDELVEFAEL